MPSLPWFSCGIRAMRPVVLLLALTAGPAGAVEPLLVADLVTVPNQTASSIPRSTVVYAGAAYFVAEDDLHGGELWRTDGTTAGTVRVTDACPGRCTAEPVDLTVAGGRLFFLANDGATGREVWVSDGTPVSDGTAAGTRVRHDFCPGPCHSVARPVIATATATGERLLVELGIPAIGQEPLWIVDAAGGVQPDTVLGGIGRATTHAVVWGDRLLVSVRPTTESARLWRTDLTAGGSTLLGEYDTRAELAPLVPAGNQAFFRHGRRRAASSSG